MALLHFNSIKSIKWTIYLKINNIYLNINNIYLNINNIDLNINNIYLNINNICLNINTIYLNINIIYFNINIIYFSINININSINIKTKIIKAIFMIFIIVSLLMTKTKFGLQLLLLLGNNLTSISDRTLKSITITFNILSINITNVLLIHHACKRNAIT